MTSGRKNSGRDAATERDTWQKQRRKLETEIADLERKSKVASDRLYSGAVKNPKELSDLQHQIESMGRHRSTLEETLLETMLELEEAEKGFAAAADHLLVTETAWDKNNAGLRQEQEQVALALHDLMGRRQELAKVIKPASLTLYDHVAKKQGGVAVAAVQYNMCGVCRVTVSAQKIKSAQDGDIVYCGSCGRVLYAP